MRCNKLLHIMLALILALTCCIPAALAEGDDTAWWENDVWGLEELVQLGAKAPDYNVSENRYEISTPEQLLFLSGNWKTDDTNGDGAPDAPCDGIYVLTADLDMSSLMASIGETISGLSGKSTDGYMPPIAADADETAEGGVKCAFFGTFDGAGHCVSNLRIERRNGKYAGLFGNVGHDYGEGFVKNLALLNITVICKASGGLLAGAVYGDVDNCVVTGTLDCAEKTAGGIAGKIKKNENAYLGTVRNCFVYADITVRGEGSENGAAGGVTSAQSDGGRIYNCYVGGSITVLGEGADCVGGISGNLKSGQALENTVMLLSSILVEDGTNVGLLCGSYSGETGSHLINNYVWEGTQLTGSVTSDHPESAAYTTLDAAAIMSRSLYTESLAWDFNDTWMWVGEDNAGYPMLAQFASGAPAVLEMGPRIADDLCITKPVLRASEPMTNTGYAGEGITLSCTLTLPDAMSADSVSFLYGADKNGQEYTQRVEMAQTEGGYSAAFPETEEGSWYYYFEAVVGGETYTYPSDISSCLRLGIESAATKYRPSQITLSPGATYSSVGFAWTTSVDGLTAQLRYRVAGGSEWTTQDVADISTYEIGGGRGDITGYSVDIDGLSPATEYEYMAVTNDGSETYQSEIYTFTTLPDANGYSFMLVSDLQATTEEGYYPFLYTMDGFVAQSLGGVDFVINLGDLTEDGSSLPQWRYMFNTLGEHFANTLTIFTAGNHESSGDPGCAVYKAQTNLPGGLDDEAIGDSTGSFIVGDVCFVILNTEPYSNIEGADTAADKKAYYEAQKEWAAGVYEASGCRWRIMCAHAGLIQDDADATAFIEKMCDELNVDLYFNGHIHDYYRACARDGVASETGLGTTFITTSPMGCKFDPFEEGVIDELLQFQTGGSDDARQYFTLVEVDDSGLKVTAYQLSEAGDTTKAATYESYTAIDSITLSESLSEVYAPSAEVAETPAAEGTEAAATDESDERSSMIWWIGAIIALIIAIGVTIYFCRPSRKN